MIRQDYILALIEHFFECLAIVLGLKRKKTQDHIVPLKKLYTQFLNLDREYLLNMELKEFSQIWSDAPEDLAKAEILSELFYQELTTFNTETDRHNLINKVLFLYDHIDHQSNTLSLERMERRNTLTSYLS